MGLIVNFYGKLQLGPAKAEYSLDIPLALGIIGTPLHDQDILSPTDFHSLSHERLIALIGTNELPHPTHIARREASDIRVIFLQVF